MISKTRFRGLDGVVHNVSELPVKKPGMRWSYVTKGLVLGAIKAGVLTEEAASDRYDLSADELREWRAAFDVRGFEGLKVRKRLADASDVQGSARSGVRRPDLGP